MITNLSSFDFSNEFSLSMAKETHGEEYGEYGY